MSSQKRIRVAIVDDNALVRSGYSMFIAACDDLEVVGVATDGREAIALCHDVQPDVVLMDLMMPDMNGVVATRALKAAYPQVQVIILSGYGDQSLVDQAIKIGAVSWLHKDVSIEGMAAAIRAAVAGTALPYKNKSSNRP
jgi:two-component system, NarL family, response regulator LiaR